MPPGKPRPRHIKSENRVKMQGILGRLGAKGSEISRARMEKGDARMISANNLKNAANFLEKVKKGEVNFSSRPGETVRPLTPKEIALFLESGTIDARFFGTNVKSALNQLGYGIIIERFGLAQALSRYFEESDLAKKQK